MTIRQSINSRKLTEILIGELTV